MQLANIDSAGSGSNHSARFLKSFLAVCTTFGSNVVERFHEYADARLAEELTIVEQRKRLLSTRGERPTMIQPRVLVHRTGHLE